MLGLFVIGMAGLWLIFSIWLGFVITKWIFKRFVNNAQKEVTILKRIAYLFSLAAVTILILFSPFLDQLIAYPKWQQLCSTTGDIEWGKGVDEKNALGREVITKFEDSEITVFPYILVNATSMSIYDATTKELIFRKPHFIFSARALVYIPSSSGDKSAPLLPTCANYQYMHKSDSIYKILNLKEDENQGGR